ncbi:MAG: hypothetical protein JWS12_529 [Candidatus Saccharibacteria bacterium]|nr:hypothetical protein [Candidatus Saccharibacteria bacterium]
MFAALPATANYQLNSYGFGNGGVANASTSNYALEGISGEIGGQTASTATYQVKPGFIETQQSNVPKIATFDNGSGRYYNKLHFVLDQQSNPSDATYALQISTTSDFSSGNNFVKSDLTIGATLNTTDYQTYAAWGGASGSNIIGLVPSTTYYLRAKVTQVNSFSGVSTESGYGPASSVATVGPSLSFDIDVSAIDTSTSPPFTTNFGNILPSTITDSPQKIWFSFDTNAVSGGSIYISGASGGLRSTLRSYTISSLSGDLSSSAEGFGAQNSSATQTSGGPIAAASPYNVSSQNVGIIDSTVRPMYSATAPLVAGRVSFLLKAKSKALTPQATDYAETLTTIAAGSF